MSTLIRIFKPSDRETLRHICCETGYLGKPVDPLFQDRELFADYLTKYYTDIEPESTVVLEHNGKITGYVMGCRFPKKQSSFNRTLYLSLFLRGIWRYFLRYNAASKKFVRWILTQGWRQVPQTPQNMPHFHINLLPESRNVTHTHDILEHFFKILVAAGEKNVYGQVIVFEKRRGERMFARYGFKVLDRIEVTKYRDLTSNPVYLFTVVKDLTQNPHLYGHDLWKEKDDLERNMASLQSPS